MRLRLSLVESDFQLIYIKVLKTPKPMLCPDKLMVGRHSQRRSRTYHGSWQIKRTLRKKPLKLGLKTGNGILIMTSCSHREMNLRAGYRETLYRYHRRK